MYNTQTVVAQVANEHIQHIPWGADCFARPKTHTTFLFPSYWILERKKPSRLRLPVGQNVLRVMSLLLRKPSLLKEIISVQDSKVCSTHKKRNLSLKLVLIRICDSRHYSEAIRISVDKNWCWS